MHAPDLKAQAGAARSGRRACVPVEIEVGLRWRARRLAKKAWEGWARRFVTRKRALPALPAICRRARSAQRELEA